MKGRGQVIQLYSIVDAYSFFYPRVTHCRVSFRLACLKTRSIVYAAGNYDNALTYILINGISACDLVPPLQYTISESYDAPFFTQHGLNASALVLLRQAQPLPPLATDAKPYGGNLRSKLRREYFRRWRYAQQISRTRSH
jgi:hypothetical protein